MPVCVPILQASPTRMVLSKMMEMPPNKFSSVFCAARAMAMPPTPTPASSVETSLISPIPFNSSVMTKQNVSTVSVRSAQIE